MPIRWFWGMTRTIDRIRASQELRLLNVMLVSATVAAGDSSALTELRQALNEQQGTVIKFKEKVSSKNDILNMLEGI